jgi:hypothetical protein
MTSDLIILNQARDFDLRMRAFRIAAHGRKTPFGQEADATIIFRSAIALISAAE